MTETQSTTRLPVLQIFLLSIQLVKQNIKVFIRFGLPLLVLVAIVAFGVFVAANNGTISVRSGDFPLFYTLILIITVFAIITIVAVGCHRGFLMSEEDIYNTKTFRWESREWKFLGWWLAISLLSGLMFMAYGLILTPLAYLFDIQQSGIFVNIIQLITLLPVLYVISRWSLVLPATAVDDTEASLSEAWNLSDGQGWRLTVIIGVIPFIINNALEILPAYDSFIYGIIVAAVWLLIAVFQIGLLSLSYSFLKGNISSEDETFTEF